MCYRAWRLAEAGAASEWGLRKGSRDKREGWATGELLELGGGGLIGSVVQEEPGRGGFGRGGGTGALGASDQCRLSGSPLCLVCLGSESETAGFGERARPPPCPRLAPWPRRGLWAGAWLPAPQLEVSLGTGPFLPPGT